MFAKQVLILVSSLCCLFVTESTLSDGCDECEPIDAGEGTCWNLLNSWCGGSIGSMDVTEGPSEEPELLVTAICNACDSSQGGSTSYEYSVTQGKSFCITVSGGVEWGVPGLGWNFDVETQLCFDNTKTRTVIAHLSCAPGTVTQVEVWEIQKEMTVSVELNFTQYMTYENWCSGVGPFDLGYLCSSTTSESTYDVFTYLFDFDDLDCATAPGSCDTKALTVYNTIYYEVDDTNSIINHIVEDVIPCYYEEF